MVRIRLYLLFAWLLCINMGARADNIIRLSSVEGAPSDEVTIGLSLQNSDAVSSLQVNIPLDDNLTLVEGSASIGSRCANHSLTVGVKDGMLNVLIYSVSMAAISDNNGEVATFKLKLGNQPQTFNLTPSKLILTNTSGATISGTSESGSVTTRCAKAQYSSMEVDFGEVPIRSTYQKTVTVSNVGNADLIINNLNFSDVNVFSSSTTMPLTVNPGQSKELNITFAPVERGTISKTLKVECNSVSKLNTINLKAKPFAVNELHVQPASGTSDEEVTIHLTMNNMDDICGLQVEFTLPEQFEYVANSFQLSDRKQNHEAATSLIGNVLRIIAYSMSNQVFTGSDGEIGSFKVKLVGRYGTTLTPSKTVFTATNSQLGNVVSDVYGGYVSISSPQISTANELDFGAVSVTEPCEKAFTIRNYGSAPLTVSRITFDNEYLSIKETLPMVIPSSGRSNVTVVYGSVEEASFDATMQIYSNDPDLRLKEVDIKGSRFAPNYLTVATNDIYTEDSLSIDIFLNTYDVVKGLQYDVVYPKAYYTTFDNNYQLESRAEGMTVNVLQLDENTLRVFCYFLGGGGIAAGQGRVMSLKLKPVGDIPEGSYDIGIKNIIFGTGDLTDKYAGSDTQSSFQVKIRPTFIPGDANGDERVSIADASLVVDYILSGGTVTVSAGADMNGDGKISIADASAIVDYILSGH